MRPVRTRRRHHPGLPSRNAGAVLFIALIVLVAMTMAGIAIMRSVDTTNLIAGNLAFKQATIQASDNGIEKAYQWLLANRPSLNSDNPAQGYSSSQSVFAWNNPAAWANAVALPADAAQNTAAYLIHRMCTLPNAAYNATSQHCATTAAVNVAPPPAEGDSFLVGTPGFLEDPKVYYRITVRTKGPRNTTSFVQAMVAIAL